MLLRSMFLGSQSEPPEHTEEGTELKMETVSFEGKPLSLQPPAEGLGGGEGEAVGEGEGAGESSGAVAGGTEGGSWERQPVTPACARASARALAVPVLCERRG